MTNFEKAIIKVLINEGGYVNNIADSGGETNFGISTRFLEKQIYGRGNVPYNYIKNLTRKDAKALYKKYFWDKISGDKIKAYPVAFAILDMSINKGPQVIINHVRQIFNQTFIPMSEQGAYMPDDTLARLNNLNTSFEQETFIDKFIEIQKQHYNSIIANNPSQEVFRNGWFSRLSSLAWYAKRNLSVWTVGGKEVTRTDVVGGAVGLIGIGIAIVLGIRVLSERKRIA